MEEDEEEKERTVVVQRKFTVKGLANVFSKLNEALLEVGAMDLSVERFTKMEHHISEDLCCCPEINKEKKKEREKQTLVMGFLR